MVTIISVLETVYVSAEFLVLVTHCQQCYLSPLVKSPISRHSHNDSATFISPTSMWYYGTKKPVSKKSANKMEKAIKNNFDLLSITRQLE